MIRVGRPIKKAWSLVGHGPSGAQIFRNPPPQAFRPEGEDDLPEMSDREEEYVDRARNPRYNSRLACQCKLDEDGGDLVVTIPDQSGIIGH